MNSSCSDTSSGSDTTYDQLLIGVLALQGDFEDHIDILNEFSVNTRTVRTPSELEGLDALLIPGGESTSIALLAEKIGLLEPLRECVKQSKLPIWGTCAGMVFLSDEITSSKEGGQALLGGIPMTCDRNYFGSQCRSFESRLSIPVLGYKRFNGVFIRAPACTSTDATVLARFKDVIVAVEHGNLLATAFHPELANDNRMHEYFLNKVIASKSASTPI